MDPPKVEKQAEKPGDGIRGITSYARRTTKEVCMADEVKQEEKKDNKLFATLFKIVLGLVFLVFGGWALYKGWDELLIVIKGTVGLFFILAGIITLAIAKE